MYLQPFWGRAQWFGGGCTVAAAGVEYAASPRLFMPAVYLWSRRLLRTCQTTWAQDSHSSGGAIAINADSTLSAIESAGGARSGDQGNIHEPSSSLLSRLLCAAFGEAQQPMPAQPFDTQVIFSRL